MKNLQLYRSVETGRGLVLSSMGAEVLREALKYAQELGLPDRIQAIEKEISRRSSVRPESVKRD